MHLRHFISVLSPSLAARAVVVDGAGEDVLVVAALLLVEEGLLVPQHQSGAEQSGHGENDENLRCCEQLDHSRPLCLGFELNVPSTRQGRRINQAYYTPYPSSCQSISQKRICGGYYIVFALTTPEHMRYYGCKLLGVCF